MQPDISILDITYFKRILHKREIIINHQEIFPFNFPRLVSPIKNVSRDELQRNIIREIEAVLLRQQ